MISPENNATREVLEHLDGPAEEILAKGFVNGADNGASRAACASTPEILCTAGTPVDTERPESKAVPDANLAKVSVFPDIATTTPDMTTTMDMILACIVAGKWRESVADYRAMPETDAVGIERKKAAKRAMPSFTAAGVFRLRKKSELALLSGYAVLDLDKVQSLVNLKTKLASLPYVLAVFVSLGGDGLKAIIRIPAWVKNAEDFELFIPEAMIRVSAEIGAPIDISGKDVCRACFVSDDPFAYKNPEATPYPGTREEALMAAPVRTKSATKPASARKTPQGSRVPRRTRATAHDIEVALASLPPLNYDEWIKVIAAVHDAARRGVISDDEVEPLLRRYHPEVTEAEYAYKLNHLLDQVHLETLFFMANRCTGARWHKKGACHV